MLRPTVHILTFLCIFLTAFFTNMPDRHETSRGEEHEGKPSDWFYRQRAYPQGLIDPALRNASLQQAEQLKATTRQQTSAVWISKGPSNVGGRITTLAISQQTPAIVYAGGADGGVLKSTNNGANWTPLTDNQPSLSIGALAVDPTNDNIVYAGTGEANSSGDSYDGFGMVKSTNGGATWFSLGLEGTRHIGKIIVDPTNTNIIFVAALGTLFTGNPERGIYKSTDAGATWNRSLFVNDSTGVVDLAINPQNPNILLAAAWQRMRGPEGRRYVGGVHTGIYRTTNGGATWQLLAGGLPGPSPILGRPGVAIAPSDPLVAYVCYADDPGYFLGVFKTTNGGTSWVQTNDASLGGLYSNFGWYFGNVFVSPTNPNLVFVSGVPLAKTTNGGAIWTSQYTSHADNHAMAFDPTNPDIILVGNDGGICITPDAGTSWYREPDQDLFITQFYAGAIDYQNPSRSMGGTQDNGTPRTTSGNLSDWGSINGGDGFYCPIDYTNSNFQYAESQYGVIARTTNNWASAFDGTNGIDPGDRKNWSTPIIIDPINPQIIYTGTHRLYKSINRAASWTTISGDLTNGEVPGFGAFATITTIDVAATDGNIIIVGTDDANVWVTSNGGTNWIHRNIGLPQRWITRVRFDPTDAGIAYVTCSGYRIDSKLPHVFRTSDFGATWHDISSNLPEAPVNVILVDPQYTNRLYIGTDVGTYFTTNTGTSRSSMGSGLPNVAISDMQLHPPTRIARAYTHGRSMWEINLDDLVTSVAPEQQLPTSIHLLQNFPNPFNPGTTIAFALSADDMTTLAICDVTGRELRTLVHERIPAGKHSITWDGRDGNGVQVASGVYFYRLLVGSGTATQQLARKMLLMK